MISLRIAKAKEIGVEHHMEVDAFLLAKRVCWADSALRSPGRMA